ncbi:hypothetical protein Ancab_013628 [Ancistrocladus abbreviatus]
MNGFPLSWQQIHALVMSSCFIAIEIKTAHSLESWNGGVIVMVTGSAQVRDFSGRKKFAETFLLAPQENGYFVLNDIFHFINEEQIHSYPAALMAANNLHPFSNYIRANFLLSVPNYVVGGVLQGRKYMASVDIKENGNVDKYPLPEQRLQQVPIADNILPENPREQANGFHENATNAVQEVPNSSMEESISEPQKHTYASVLRAKGQSGPSIVPPASSNKNKAAASEWHQTPQQSNQQLPIQHSQQSTAASAANDDLGAEVAEDISLADEKGEIKSVYVRTLPPTVSVSEIEEEFKKFGELRPAGDTDVCYAFVEFEDIIAAQDAIKAATVQVARRQVYIEERRANNSFARGSYYRQTTRQDEGFSENLASRNGQIIESAD